MYCIVYKDEDGKHVLNTGDYEKMKFIYEVYKGILRGGELELVDLGECDEDILDIIKAVNN